MPGFQSQGLREEIPAEPGVAQLPLDLRVLQHLGRQTKNLLETLPQRPQLRFELQEDPLQSRWPVTERLNKASYDSDPLPGPLSEVRERDT